MERTKLDKKLLSRFLRGELQPVKEKVIEKEKPFFLTGSDLHFCGLGEFIAVICCSFGAGLYEEEYAPYPQVWFTALEAAEKCISRGYQLTTDEARQFLGTILERWHNLIEYRDNITIGQREYRRVRLDREEAEKCLGVCLPRLKCEWPPPQEWRTRYNRDAYNRKKAYRE